MIGGVAATLNSDFFSTSCWGIVTQPVCIAADFLALAALAGMTGQSGARSWIRVVLAGLAVGAGVMHGADVGALFSLFVAAYVLYQALFLEDGKPGLARKFGWGVARVAIVAVFAAFIATHTLSTLVGTQIQGIAGMAQDEATRKQRWDFATEWSLPKVEVLQVVVPGLFGYRNNWHMYDDDQPTDDQYWGLIGETPPPPPPNLWRLSGTGLYAGVFVLLVAFWAILQSFRRRGSPFTTMQRRAIWFWTFVLVATTLLAFGSYAPFYQFFYALPYAPTIRNPTKFMHIFSWALVIVFAYGAHGLVTTCMQNPLTGADGVLAPLKNGWAKAAAFDRRWLLGCLGAIGASLLAFLIYFAFNDRLQSYLNTVGIPAAEGPGVARFSLHAVAWFILFLVLAVGLFAAILSGQFSGRRAKWGASLIILLILVDLVRADLPWIVYWNTDIKYTRDPVTDFLADKPYEHRVSMLPVRAQNAQLAIMQNGYYSQWKQHLYPYYNIQCAESIQESRIAVDKDMFLAALPLNSANSTIFDILRTWELLNTRYVLGPGDPAVVEQLNQALDPAKKRFSIAKFPDGQPVRFNFEPRRPELDQSMQIVDYNLVPNTNGQLAVLEFAGALPRASLFSNWRADTNDYTTLSTLSDPNFDPHQTVLVSDPIAPPLTADAAQPGGTVQINTNYQPRRVELEADVKVPSVLLLCDRYNPKWVVTVDGQPAKLLRCNFIERGVLLPPGKHVVVFRFTGSITTFAVSLAGVVLALVLCGWLVAVGEGPSPLPVPSPGSDNPPPNPPPPPTQRGVARAPQGGNTPRPQSKAKK